MNKDSAKATFAILISPSKGGVLVHVNLNAEVPLTDRGMFDNALDLPYIITKDNCDGTYLGHLDVANMSGFQKTVAIADLKSEKIQDLLSNSYFL